MSRQSTPILTLPIIASGAVAVHRFVTPVGAQAGDGVNTIGASAVAAASGEAFAVDHLGTTVIEAGAAFSKGDAIQSNADGKAILKAAGVAVARALQDSTGAGDYVEVTLIPN